MKSPKGLRQDTRRKLSKHPRQRGKISISRFFQNFEIGDYVAIDIEPSYHKGMPHPKFQGKTGIIIGKQGEAYVLLIRDGNKVKKILSLPVHLKRVNPGAKADKKDIEKLLIQFKRQKEEKKKKIERLIKIYKQYHVKENKLRRIL